MGIVGNGCMSAREKSLVGLSFLLLSLWCTLFLHLVISIGYNYYCHYVRERKWYYWCWLEQNELKQRLVLSALLVSADCKLAIGLLMVDSCVRVEDEQSTHD